MIRICESLINLSQDVSSNCHCTFCSLTFWFPLNCFNSIIYWSTLPSGVATWKVQSNRNIVITLWIELEVLLTYKEFYHLPQSKSPDEVIKNPLFFFVLSEQPQNKVCDIYSHPPMKWGGGKKFGKKQKLPSLIIKEKNNFCVLQGP